MMGRKVVRESTSGHARRDLWVLTGLASRSTHRSTDAGDIGTWGVMVI